jgi:phosphatidylinositol-3-phosphatase
MPRLVIALCALLLLALPVRETKAGAIEHVIVIAMENQDARRIYGNTREAPYINKTLKPLAARAGNFRDILPLKVRSGPHYILMQAGTREFVDHVFESNDDPSATNSTASVDHLIRQLDQSNWPVKPTWMAYQQGLNAETGACPVVSAGHYVARHNPFVYFQDISGNPPDKNNAACAAHHKPLSALSADIKADTLANYVFITPDQCHNMHNKCTAASRIRAGDRWLEKRMPKLMAWATDRKAVIFIVWDEGRDSRRIPFLAIGPGVRKGFVSGVELDHRSYVKSLSEIFGVPVLPTVQNATTFSSLFKAGQYP